MNTEKYLPLGSVVLLKEAQKRIMIIGFMASAKETGDKVFDYMGCLYPEGVLSTEQTLVFDHSQIANIYSLGYSDEEEKTFKVQLNNFLVSNSNESTNVMNNYNQMSNSFENL